MTYQAVAPWPVIGRQALERFVAALLIVMLLAQTLVEIFPATMFETLAPAAPITEAQAVDSPYGLTPVAQPLPPLWLPTELVGKPEVVAMRGANRATFDVGNNTYATVQDVNPLHFQDKNGQWQRIDPTFIETPLGWLNGTNTVRTLVEKRFSNATLAAEDVSIRFKPNGLVLVDKEGDRTMLAEPLPVALAKPVTVDAQASTTRYTESWSLPGLQDQWQTGAGRSEYTMRLAELPTTEWWRGAPQALDMRVRLQLNPGTTLQVDGQPVTLPLATQRPITFVGAKGEAMVLQPPRTFEQNHPETNVAAEYLLSATNETDVVELRVRTPWAWLAAADRQFPVIIDPVFQMRNATFGARADYIAETNAYNNLFDFSSVRVGKRTGLYDRGVLRFDLPIMPFGTSIAKAYLYAVPQDVNHGGTGADIDFNREYLVCRIEPNSQRYRGL